MAERKDVVRNRKAIWQAYTELAKDRPIEKITVRDVVKTADISRATFYSHYKDIHSLEEEIYEEMLKAMIQYNIGAIDRLLIVPQESLMTIFKAFEKNRELLRVLGGVNQNDAFFSVFKNRLYNLIFPMVNGSGNSESAHMIALAVSAVVSDNCRDIVFANRNVSIEKRAAVTQKFIPKIRK